MGVSYGSGRITRYDNDMIDNIIVRAIGRMDEPDEDPTNEEQTNKRKTVWHKLGGSHSDKIDDLLFELFMRRSSLPFYRLLQEPPFQGLDSMINTPELCEIMTTLPNSDQPLVGISDFVGFGILEEFPKVGRTVIEVDYYLHPHLFGTLLPILPPNKLRSEYLVGCYRKLSVVLILSSEKEYCKKFLFFGPRKSGRWRKETLKLYSFSSDQPHTISIHRSQNVFPLDSGQLNQLKEIYSDYCRIAGYSVKVAEYSCIRHFD